MFIIYAITNKVNDRVYIGSTNDIERRWREHHWAHTRKNFVLYRAMRKYGFENFQINQIDSAPSRAKLHELEKQCIAEYNSYRNGYNSTIGGDHLMDPKAKSDLMKRRHQAGEFVGQNQKRIDEGNHHFVGDANPTRKLAAQGLQHNQLKKPWENSKTASNPESIRAWKMADQLHAWYLEHLDKKRGGGPYTMARDFGLNCSLQKMYYVFFNAGWVPTNDIDWVKFSTDKI